MAGMTNSGTTSYLVTHTLTRNGEALEETHRRTFPLDDRALMIAFLIELGVNNAGRHGNSTEHDEEGTFATAMAGAKGVIWACACGGATLAVFPQYAPDAETE